MTNLIVGSQYALAMLYEIVLSRKVTEGSGVLNVKPDIELLPAVSEVAKNEEDGCVLVKDNLGKFSLLTYSLSKSNTLKDGETLQENCR
jgi:hypothetical protein